MDDGAEGRERMNRDQFTAAWVLIGGSVLLGVWYWRLSPAEKLSKLGRSGAGAAPAGGLQVVPINPGLGDFDPSTAGTAENARRAREQLEKQAPIPPTYTKPFNASELINALARIFVG
jgi:hypothetical protein